MQGQNLRFERLWTRAVLGFVVLFSLYFIIKERDGLQRLLVWTWEGLSDAPAAIQNIFNYYATTPLDLLAASLLIGAIFGVGASLYLTARRARRRYGSRWQRVLMGTPSGRRLIFNGALLGLTGGTLGSQILNLPLQHCTYAADAAPTQQVLGVVLTLLSCLLVLSPLWWWFNRQSSKTEGISTAGYFRSPILPYLFLLPTLLSLGLFLYYPSLQTINLSLFSRRFPLPQERFVCLSNYVTLAEDVIYQNSFLTTFLITLAVVIISMSLSLAIAVLASQKIKGASIYRTLLIWPFALSPVVAGVIFLAMFREGGSGLINYGLERLFGVSLSWLRNPSLAPWVIVLASVWNILGFNILFYIAGLQNIPADLLEAAQIDGANKPQRFFRITLPLLAPFTFFLMVTNVTYSFYGIYGAVDTLTQGGPPLGAGGALGGATNVLIYKLYQDAFNPGSPVGLAAAQALIMFIMVAGITLFQFRYIENRITYSG